MQEIIVKDNKSDVFTLITYPDGQKSLKLDLELLNIKMPITIRCRIKNFSELEILGCLISALNKNSFRIIEINFIYLFGIRSDRPFEIGQPDYFHDVIAPIIKSYNIETAYICWPFAPLAIETHDIYTLLPHEVEGFDEIRASIYRECNLIIAGDESAFAMSEFLCWCHFKKNRNAIGDIEINIDDHLIENIRETDNIITIIDDLCDGGRTFIEEAKIIRSINKNSKLRLFVFHGLFTNGLDPLLEYFDEIICTNSYQDISHPKVKQWRII